MKLLRKRKILRILLYRVLLNTIKIIYVIFRLFSEIKINYIEKKKKIILFYSQANLYLFQQPLYYIRIPIEYFSFIRIEKLVLKSNKNCRFGVITSRKETKCTFALNIE